MDENIKITKLETIKSWQELIKKKKKRAAEQQN